MILMTNQVCRCTLVVYRGHDYVLISKYNWHITVLKCHLSLIRFPDLKFLDLNNKKVSLCENILFRFCLYIKTCFMNQLSKCVLLDIVEIIQFSHFLKSPFCIKKNGCCKVEGDNLGAFQYLCRMNPARRNRWFLLLGTPIGRDL